MVSVSYITDTRAIYTRAIYTLSLLHGFYLFPLLTKQMQQQQHSELNKDICLRGKKLHDLFQVLVIVKY